MRISRHKHKNLLFLIFGLIIAFLVISNKNINELVLGLKQFSYFGVFLGGMLFVSTFTFATGVVILFSLAEHIPTLPMILLATFGAVFADYLIFRFVKDDVEKEIQPLYTELEKLGKKNHLRKLIHTKYFGWTLPVIGALVMASPLPDELGISLMGISNIKTSQFLIVSLLSHGVGMTIVVSAAVLI